MEKKIEIFTATLFYVEYTLLRVLTKKGYFVGVAPQSLENVVSNGIDNEHYHRVKQIDNLYGYVLEDEIIENYLNDGLVDYIYYRLNEIDDDNLFNFSSNEI